jgi:Asp-tRNA(Asn)/Glu-tRNA(Gln) amidotransferase B subunit
MTAWLNHFRREVKRMDRKQEVIERIIQVFKDCDITIGEAKDIIAELYISGFKDILNKAKF